MLYVFCEDKTAGHKFWESLAYEYFNLPKENVISCEGVTRIAYMVKQVSLDDEDTAIILIDQTGRAQYTTALDAIRAEAFNKGFSVILNAYYCFESFLLSFREVHVWGQCISPEVLSVFLKVHTKMWAGGDWFEGLDTDYKRIWSLRNPERLANTLLGHVTQQSGTTFHVHKTYLGDCWVSDCTTRTECAACKMNKSFMTTRLKLDYIIANSLPLLDGVALNSIQECR